MLFTSRQLAKLAQITRKIAFRFATVTSEENLQKNEKAVRANTKEVSKLFMAILAVNNFFNVTLEADNRFDFP